MTHKPPSSIPTPIPIVTMASLPVSSLNCPLFPSRLHLRRPNPHLRPTPLTPAQRSPIAASQKTLPPLYDDGYLTPRGIGDYIEAVGDVIKYDADGGLPRWFCPIECGPPVKDASLLLFLPILVVSGWVSLCITRLLEGFLKSGACTFLSLIAHRSKDWSSLWKMSWGSSILVPKLSLFI